MPSVKERKIDSSRKVSKTSLSRVPVSIEMRSTSGTGNVPLWEETLSTKRDIWLATRKRMPNFSMTTITSKLEWTTWREKLLSWDARSAGFRKTMTESIVCIKSLKENQFSLQAIDNSITRKQKTCSSQQTAQGELKSLCELVVVAIMVANGRLLTTITIAPDPTISSSNNNL